MEVSSKLAANSKFELVLVRPSPARDVAIATELRRAVQIIAELQRRRRGPHRRRAQAARIARNRQCAYKKFTIFSKFLNSLC
jgi:hypothetical protein